MEEIENPVLLLAVGVAGLVVNLIGLMLFHNHVHGEPHNFCGNASCVYIYVSVSVLR